jgi:transcriptional regulator with XRE-family HTH domain
VARIRPYSPQVIDAARLLGEQVRLARRSRRWTQADLAGRAGITADTLRKVENGDLSVSLGTALEVAALVGVPLFHDEAGRLTLDLDRTQARSALLPQRIRRPPSEVKDDF